MDIEIEIGREVESANAYQIPSTYKRVSRHHATLHWHDGIATLEDMSTNGTFVNGRRITQAKIREDDTVWLGGIGTYEQGFQLDVMRLFATCREIDNSQRNDGPRNNYGSNNRYPEAGYLRHDNFSRKDNKVSNRYSESGNTQRTEYSREFAHIKQIYINYHEELSKLKSKTSMRMQLPRLLLSLIPAVLGIVFMFVLGFGSMGFIAMMVGSVLSGVIGTLTMGRSNSKQEKLAEDILDLQLKYQKEYRCPKCGKEYSLDLHWKKLQADGKCPYGCGAQFV